MITPKKKILLLGTQMQMGGAQKVLFTQANWFHNRGHEVVTAFLYDKKNIARDWKVEYPFEVINLNIWSYERNLLFKLPRFFLGLINLYRFLTRNKFNIIETFTQDSNLVGIPLAFLAKIPLRIPSHHGEIVDRNQFWKWLHLKMVNSKMTSLLVVVSSRIKKNLSHIGKVNTKKITVILNGIQVNKDLVDRYQARKSLGWSQKDLTLVSIGRLSKPKGHKYLIDALPEIIDKHPNTMLYIVGEGKLRKKLEKQIDNHNLKKNIVLLGFRTDIYEILRASDLFVMPSIWEGLPLALLEAMLMECPIIVSDVEGIDDVITHNVNGVITPSKDVGNLTESILMLLGDSDKRLKMGKEARKHVLENFSEEEMCKQYEKVFLI